MSAREAAEPLPVRERYTEVELKLMDSWIKDHGDPAEWSEEIRRAYANTIANMRAGGSL